MSTTLTLRDKAAIHRERYDSGCRFAGQPGEYDHINVRHGQAAAARHDFLLRLVCLEAGEAVAERLEEDLEEQIHHDEFGDDGAAAYYEARTSIAELDAEAEELDDVLIAITCFARAARRACKAASIRRAL